MEEQNKVQVSTYSHDELIAAAAAFNVTREAMAGALYGQPEPLTKSEAEEAVHAFLNQTAK